MVCTYTNVAVDNLVEGFVKAGLNPVRIGYGQANPALREYSFEFKIEQHPLYPEYDAVSKNSEKLERDLRQSSAHISERREQGAPSHELSRLKSSRDVLDARLSRLNSRRQSMYQQIQTEVLNSADVVRFPTSHTFSVLMYTFRYALPASVLGLSC